MNNCSNSYCQGTSNFNVSTNSAELTPITMAIAQYSCLPCASTGNCVPQNFSVSKN